MGNSAREEMMQRKIAYFAHQQYLYMEGYPSIWGYWNRMAEYLMRGARRLRHGK